MDFSAANLKSLAIQQEIVRADGECVRRRACGSTFSEAAATHPSNVQYEPPNPFCPHKFFQDCPTPQAGNI